MKYYNAQYFVKIETPCLFHIASSVYVLDAFVYDKVNKLSEIAFQFYVIITKQSFC